MVTRWPGGWQIGGRTFAFAARCRLRWIALNAALFLGMAAVAYGMEGWQPALPFVAMFAVAATWVLLRRPSPSHP